MATVCRYMQCEEDFIAELQRRTDIAEGRRHKRFKAAVLIQRMVRGWLIRQHMARLHHAATVIQCAFRCHLARKLYRIALRTAVRRKHALFYYEASTKIEALWRGYYSRRTKFWFKAYRRWLATVRERSERKAAEAAEYGIRSRSDDLKLLEGEARQWLAFVMFKLHHLLRTACCPGVYSIPFSKELSEFEKLLMSIHYREYMKRLRRKYDEFVRKHRPRFSNKRLFPIIGDGADYWYLSLPEMYELTIDRTDDLAKADERFRDTHHGPQHKKPFLWRKPRPDPYYGKGPFRDLNAEPSKVLTPTPAPSMVAAGDVAVQVDPRFCLYVKHYKPQPNLMEYIDFHINTFLTHTHSIQNLKTDDVC